jgi:elongation factor G
MKVYDTPQIRNVAVLGHGDSGKTSLVAALLYAAGAATRLGSVPDGTTLTDFDEEEIARKISLSAALAHLEHAECKVNLIDAPGYANFIGDASAAVRVGDTALVVVHGVDGTGVQTERSWKSAEQLGIPVIFSVSLLDRDRGDFDKQVAALQELFDRRAVPIHMPLGKEAGLEGVVDLLSLKAYRPKSDSAEVVEGEIPDEAQERASSMREALVEMVAESDETLMEAFFAEGTLSPEQLRTGLRKAVLERAVFPVTATAAAKMVGVHPLLDALTALVPSPADRPAATGKDAKGEETSREPSDDAPFSALVFKTIADPFSGRISLMRVLSGVAVADAHVYNASREDTERLTGLSVVQGKQQTKVAELRAGDIGAVTKLKETQTGDTLCEKSSALVYPPISFPQPAISFAVEPKSKGDEEKLGSSLQRLAEEDPTLRIERDPQTGELLAYGLGMEHVKVALEKMHKRFGVEAILHQPKVPYRETITREAKSMYRHKKQTGGAGQFAEVHMRVEPLPAGEGFVYDSEIFGGTISRGFWPSIEKGIKSVMAGGVIAGYPVVDLKAVIFDGKEHPVDSKDIAFQIAGREVFKTCFKEARPVILEPIMSVTVTCPEECMGDVMGDLSGRRGKVQGMDAVAGRQVIKALVPMSEMLEYANTLKSVTSDRGSFSMELDHYEAVPAQIQQKLVEEHEARRTGGED